MRRASPEESFIDEAIIFEVQISQEEFNRLFPVDLDELDVLAAPEPSLGAMIQLETGHYLVVIYGKVTHSLTILKSLGEETQVVLNALFNEVPQLKR